MTVCAELGSSSPGSDIRAKKKQELLARIQLIAAGGSLQQSCDLPDQQVSKEKEREDARLALAAELKRLKREQVPERDRQSDRGRGGQKDGQSGERKEAAGECVHAPLAFLHSHTQMGGKKELVKGAVRIVGSKKLRGLCWYHCG